MYADQKGKNDWMIENIGEVTDAVFIGNKQSYFLSDDNLLTLFDNGNKVSIWRKQLPSHNSESYALRHIDDTLFALSNERALIINLNGQVLQEIPLIG